MLIFCGLLALGRFHMALHLPDDSQTVDGVSAPGTVNAAHILDLLFFQPLLLHGDVLLFLWHSAHPPFCFISACPAFLPVILR